MNPLLFFIAFLGVFILLNVYISKRFINILHISDKLKNYFKVFLVVNLFGIIGYAMGRYYIEMPNWLYFLFSLPIGVLFLLFCTAVLYDITHSVSTFVPMSEKRRGFFKKTLDASAVVTATGLSARAIYEATFIKLERVNVKLQNLKRPYKIVQLSDVHIGGLIDEKFIKNLVERVNTLNPDIVVLTGDLVDIEINKATPALKEFQNLQTKYGTYFSVGNHEYFHNINAIIDKVSSLGIKVLENENVYIGEDGKGFNLAGVYDIFGYRVNHHLPDIYKALENKQDAPTVLLAHQPRYVDEVTKGVDLMLSGHTHGGQLYPFRFLVKLQQPYISGLHQHNKELQVYVNKGTGFWGPPMRLGASSEITEILLHA